MINSAPLLQELRPYRRPGDPWQFAGSRQEDYGLASKWQHIVQVAHGLARYLCIPDDLRVGLASIPLMPLVGEGPSQ